MQFSVILLTVFSVVVQVALCEEEHEGYMNGEICLGQTDEWSKSGNGATHYKELKEKLTNCSFITNNVKIVGPDLGENGTLDFLESIVEVNGYVSIQGPLPERIKELPFKNLQVIRGESLVHFGNGNPKRYSLFIYNLPHIESLGLTRLSEISKGDVFIRHNNRMCFGNNVDWEDVFATHTQIADVSLPERNDCPTCAAECEDGQDLLGSRYCWGPGIANCQNKNKVTCANQCEYRCFGSAVNECCHPECLAGCSGPYATDCWGCRNFYNNGTCIGMCPKKEIYNATTYRYDPNPLGTVSFGRLCLKKCPPNYLEFNEGCLSHKCPDGYEAVDGKCLPCTGVCPRTCDFSAFSTDNFIKSEDLKREEFQNCTVIAGSVFLISGSFQSTRRGKDHSNTIPAVTVEDLKIFESVEKITGILNFQPEGHLPELKSMEIFKNLRSIDGVTENSEGFSLTILSEHIEYLGMTNLEKISSGRIWIEAPKLCYVPDFRHISFGTDNIISSSTTCEVEGKVCHPECNSWCYGPVANMCNSCKNFIKGDECVPSCNIAGYYAGPNKTCEKCHEECLGSCSGPLASNCTHCKNFKDGPYCTPACPVIKYTNNVTKTCEPCNNRCINSQGCTGPEPMLAEGGCNACFTAVFSGGSDSTALCLERNSLCPAGTYQDTELWVSSANVFSKNCLSCNEKCETCSHHLYCDTCEQTYFTERRDSSAISCVNECNRDIQYANLTSNTCHSCHSNCRGCTGPTEHDCIKCYSYKDYLSESKFSCILQCPADRPFKHSEGIEQVCVAEAATTGTILSEKDKIGAIVGGVIGLIVLVVAAIIVAYCCRQRAVAKRNVMEFTVKMEAGTIVEPLDPTQAEPDLSRLRLIKESELKRGVIIGSGAFGTVYKGFWIPEDESVKMPVAIKVLIEGTSPAMNTELLEEARIMASVDHPCCIKILAVCMTAQMMLLTQLMPDGSLLTYVKKNSSNIGSKVLLNWCTQIAKGMAYLQSMGIVHRDLAARNVLVQSPRQVKITDFGLAKLLNTDEDYYKAESGKVPIKWMALESIQHRIFDYKTDVWSYGVTVWEILTFGQKPYESIRAREIPAQLERGERLHQPTISTIDVYMLMIKCWLLDSAARPSFLDLAMEFAKMARDPGRYLVIEGDALMRLPTTKRDNKELLEGLTEEEFADKELINADDYLHPSDGREHRYENDIVVDDRVAPGYLDVKNQLTVDSDKSGSISPNRYTSTPTLPVGSGMAAAAVEDYLEPVSSGAKSKPIVDEDDYLQPRSQTQSSYVDVIADDEDVVTNKKRRSKGFYNDLAKEDSGIPLLSAENEAYMNTDIFGNSLQKRSMSNNNGSPVVKEPGVRIGDLSCQNPDYVNQDTSV